MGRGRVWVVSYENLIYLTSVPTAPTAVSPLNDGVILISLSGAPLLSVLITSISAGIVESSLLISEGKHTRLT